MTSEQIHIGNMSHETAIGILKLMLEAMETYDGISPTPARINAFKMAIEALEQEPTNKNDLVTLTFSKGTLKYSCKDYVVYKKDWLRSHYGAEIDIMFGDSQYKEPTTKNNLGVDCIDRAKAQTAIEMNAFRYTLAKERGGTGKVEWDSHLIAIDDAVDIIRNLPSVTPQNPTRNNLGVDCISRDAVNDLIIWYENGNKLNAKELLELVRRLPSVTPQPRWIPVSERAAEFPCLACDIFEQIFIPIGIVVLNSRCYEGKDFAFNVEKFLKGKEVTLFGGEKVYEPPREIVAWMPLPEPYRAESEDQDGQTND